MVAFYLQLSYEGLWKSVSSHNLFSSTKRRARLGIRGFPRLKCQTCTSRNKNHCHKKLQSFQSSLPIIISSNSSRARLFFFFRTKGVDYLRYGNYLRELIHLNIVNLKPCPYIACFIISLNKRKMVALINFQSQYPWHHWSGDLESF